MLHTSLILAVAHPHLLEATGIPSSGAQPSLTQSKRKNIQYLPTTICIKIL